MEVANGTREDGKEELEVSVLLGFKFINIYQDLCFCTKTHMWSPQVHPVCSR